MAKQEVKVKWLENMEQLEVLSIEGAEISDTGFRSIAHMPRLTCLLLFGPPKMTDEAFAAFPADSPIGKLRLNQGHFTGSGLKYLIKLENLVVLKLNSDVAFDKSSVQSFKSKKKLYTLELTP